MAPRVLQSPFAIGEVNPTIRLAEAPAIIRKDRESLALEDTEVYLGFEPSPRVRFEGAGHSTDIRVMNWSLNGWSATVLSMPSLAGTGRLYGETVQVGGDFRTHPFEISVGGELREMRVGRARRLRSILFHVANFPDFLGRALTDESGTWMGRLELAAGGWRIRLDARHEMATLVDTLREQGGYAITHVGELTNDAGSFIRGEAEDVLTGLHWFLSFVRGAWTSPLLFYGKAARGGATWNLWASGRTDRWGGLFQWCDTTNWTAAQEAYDGYATLWPRPDWQQGLRVLVGLYVTANRSSGIETAIIAAQSGLELLGWLRFVETRRIGAKSWRAMHADDKIRRLLGLGKVDLSIPSRTPALVGLDRSWRDGPSVVAGVRNRLVHPRRTGASVSWSPDVLAEAWLLSSRYLELALLHALGVASGVRDRLAASPYAGAIAIPPWAVP